MNGSVSGLMRNLIILGDGWLGRAASRAARRRGLDVETVRRVDRPEVFPPATAEALGALLADADAVVNTCGVLRGDGEHLDSANHHLARFVAEAIAPGTARLVHVGSAAEYGPPVSAMVHEADETAPTSTYGRTKLAGTRAVLDVCGPGRAVVARVFNPVGPGQPDHLPVSEFARAARSTEPGPLVIRNAATERDFVPIDDVGQALIALATTQRAVPPIVNVCTGIGLRYGDIAGAMLRQVGADRVVRSLDEPGTLSVVGDPRRLEESTGLLLTTSAEAVAALALAAADP